MEQTLPIHHSAGLQYQLAFHCAPAIAGIKAANLICLGKAALGSGGPEEILSPLKERGVEARRLADYARRTAYLIYHRTLLEAQLGLPEHRRYLERLGYPAGGLDAMLDQLAHRVGSCRKGTYPHEIGLFLGYPLGDVTGFIDNRGAGYQLCGYWKVYGDPEQAKRLFCAYDSVRSYYCARTLRGEEIHHITYGGRIQ